ncbi:MAG: HEPN-associated N-terminal domain-containing protein [Solirubrobacteraceae bacterium]|jgi:hypothetical protein
MGFFKNRQIEQEEMGVSSPLGYAVCAACVADHMLAEFIEENLTAAQCSFCGRSENTEIAADADVVLARISEGLKTEWSRAIDELGYDSESNSGFAGPTRDAWEVFEQIGPIFANDAFEEFVVKAFDGEVWCQRDPYGTTVGEALRYGWEDLAETVKHYQRFVFFLPKEEMLDDEPGAEVPRGGKMLEELSRLIRHYQLVKDLPGGTSLYRCRLHGVRKKYSEAKDLGAPPAEEASQSRMSPAGIPMLYAADEPETALAETIDPKRTRTKGATIATFQLTAECRIIDLSRLPPVPSIFDADPEAPRLRQELGFLHGFRRDVGGQVERDGREHIEYVPTQVVCEYLRHAFRDDQGRSVRGLAWESVKRPGARNIVLFIDRDHCVERGERPERVPEPLVELISSEPRRLP